MPRYVFTRKRRVALGRAQRKWKNMSRAARRKAMSGRGRRR